jgi:excisionase family DNA binding protein
MNNTFLTATEVSRLLKVSRALSYRWIAEGKIRSLRVGRTVRVRQEDLEAFILQNMQGEGAMFIGTAPPPDAK